MRNGSALHRLWWQTSEHGMTGLWRMYCWGRGHHEPRHMDVYFEMCVLCCRTLWSSSREGFPSPYMPRDTDGRPQPVLTAPIGRRARTRFLNRQRAAAEEQEVLGQP